MERKNFLNSFCFFVTIFLWNAIGMAQTTDSTQSHWQWSGYAEIFYAYDFNKPGNGRRPNFLYSYNRHNQPNLNIGMLKGAFAQQRWRANLALMAGTYAQDNLAQEPALLRHVLEANAGYRLSQRHQLWLDAGVFASHIGFESAIGKDCQTLSRSIVADNSPYYELGAKLTYQNQSGRWLLSALLLNGWQQMRWNNGEQIPAFGLQMQHKPNGRWLLNYSNFYGSIWPKNNRKMRHYHNLYGLYTPSARWNFTIGFDLGSEQKEQGSSQWYTWMSPVGIVRFVPRHRVAIACRAEYFRDVNGVVIPGINSKGIATWGFSSNVDFAISGKLLWRTEWRYFSNKDAFFLKREQDFVRQNAAITTSFSYAF